MVVLVWLDRPQFPPWIIKKKNKSKERIPVIGYKADLENTEKILPPAPQKPRNQNQLM